MRQAMDEVFDRVGAFFMKQSPQHAAARRLAAVLDADGIPYAIAGAMALNAHGHRRTTEDVDVLLTREGLQAFKERHPGRGGMNLFPNSKGMRDAVENVKIPNSAATYAPGVHLRGSPLLLGVSAVKPSVGGATARGSRKQRRRRVPDAAPS